MLYYIQPIFSFSIEILFGHQNAILIKSFSWFNQNFNQLFFSVHIMIIIETLRKSTLPLNDSVFK